MGTMTNERRWARLEEEVVSCTRCPRLIRHCRDVARTRRRAFRDQEYWGRPVPGFGDHGARILVLGLAPAAHGANRTGRMFTGDRSGDWLYGALHRAGLANRAEATARGDGMRLRNVFISAACRCAPPANRPARDEMERCATFLDREFEMLHGLGVTLALGRIAWDTAIRRAHRLAPGDLPRPRPRFGHGSRARLPLGANGRPVELIASYHPSQQNTLTGRLTRQMLDEVIRKTIESAAIVADRSPRKTAPEPMIVRDRTRRRKPT